MQVWRPKTSLKRDSSTGIPLCILSNFSKNLIYWIPAHDYSLWFLCYNQCFICWSLFPFFPAFFPFIIDNCNYWSLSREGIKWRFLFYFLQQFIKNQHECCQEKTFKKKAKKKKPQGYSHFYFLPFSSQKFLVLILLTLEGWKAELTLEPPSGFEHETPGLGIQCLNH